MWKLFDSLIVPNFLTIGYFLLEPAPSPAPHRVLGKTLNLAVREL